MVDEQGAVVEACLVPVLVGGQPVAVLVPAVQEPLAPGGDRPVQLLQLLRRQLLLQVPVLHELQDGPAVDRGLDHLGHGGDVVVQVGELPVGAHPVQGPQQQAQRGVQMGLQGYGVLAYLPLGGDLLADHDDHGVVDAHGGVREEGPEGVFRPRPPLLIGLDEPGHGGVEALPVGAHVRPGLLVAGIIRPGIGGVGEFLHGQGEAPVGPGDGVPPDISAGELVPVPVIAEGEAGALQAPEDHAAGPAEGRLPGASRPGLHGLMLLHALDEAQAHALVPPGHQQGGAAEGEADIAVAGQQDQLVRLPLRHEGHPPPLMGGVKVDELAAVPGPDAAPVEGAELCRGHAVAVAGDGDAEPGAPAFEDAAGHGIEALHVPEKGVLPFHMRSSYGSGRSGGAVPG